MLIRRLIRRVRLLSFAAAALAITAPASGASEMKSFLSDFDFNTGRVLIIAPDGIAPSADWSIRFLADFGVRQAGSASISLDYAEANASADILPAGVGAENAYVLAVEPELTADAARSRSDFMALTEVDGSDRLNIRMQLGASFHIDDTKKRNVCASKSPAPVDIWVKPSDTSDWQRLADMESLWKFGFFLRSAINSACPTV